MMMIMMMMMTDRMFVPVKVRFHVPWQSFRYTRRIIAVNSDVTNSKQVGRAVAGNYALRYTRIESLHLIRGQRSE